MTSADKWRRVKPILAQLIDAHEGERSAMLTALCGDDPSLANEVRFWLAAHDAASDFIERPPFGAAMIGTGRNVIPEIGRYRIIREIGRGGMGTVYLGERSDGEFDQRIAIKVVRSSLADPSLIERFRVERQILASLDHPYIARLLDGGVTEGGEPYFLMEYVDGVSIVEFASKNGLDQDQKLRLFLKVCAALSHLHRNLVIHRDIKPGNVLVTADGVPKLLDFGLAKLLSDPMASAQVTQTGLRALTPAYASPEQILNAPLTTSADVYSLGVVLFELLTGQKPYDHGSSSLGEISRTISEKEPPLPSTVGPRSLRGDIDNIVLTAIKAGKDERYESVDAFAADIERYLDGLPVRARPASVGYRTWKFLKRHRMGAACVAVIALLLVAGVVVSVWQAKKAEHERARAAAVNDFLQTMLGYTDNSIGIVRAGDRETTINDVLQNASQRLEAGELDDQPETKAELQRIIGSSYLTQGRYDEAEQNLRSSLNIKERLFGAQSSESLPVLVELAQLYVTTSRYAKAERIYDQRLAILRAAGRSGADATYLMIALNDYAVLKRAEGDSAAAETSMRECLSLEDRIPHESAMVAGVARSVYALILSDSGRFDEAEAIARKRISEIRVKPDPGTIELASNLNALGGFLTEKGESRQALSALVEAESIFRKLTGPRHLPLGDNLRYQAQALLDTGDIAQAHAKIDEALMIYRASARSNFINYPTALAIEANILLRERKIQEADTAITEAMSLREHDLPPGHVLTAVTRETLALVRASEGRSKEAAELLDASLADLTSSQIPGSPRFTRLEAIRSAIAPVVSSASGADRPRSAPAS